jgi:hypothetical protein
MCLIWWWLVFVVYRASAECVFKKLYFQDTRLLVGPEWNADSFVGESQASFIDTTSIRVTYPEGSFKSPRVGGFQFKSAPTEESDEMLLRYSIYVPPDFDFVKGGKLPGLYGGEALSGGNKTGVGITGITLRLVFRERGELEVYAYAPISKDDAISDLEDTVVNTEYGTSLMRGKTNLERGMTNTIQLRVKLGDPNEENSVIRLVVNGDTHELRNVKLRLVDTLLLTGVYFSTFFGGSTSDYSTPVEQSLVFSDFRIASWGKK